MRTDNGNINKRISKDKIKVICAPGTVILALEERGFCASLQKDGQPMKKESKEIGDFSELIGSSSVAWIDYVVDNFEKESPQIALALGFSESMVKNLIKTPIGGYEDLENEMGLTVPVIAVNGFEVTLHPLLVLIKENLILTLHTTQVTRFFRLRRYAETMMRKLGKLKFSKDRITMLLIRILDENNTRNFDHLKTIEESGDKLSEQLIDPKTPREKIGPQIHHMKHALIVYLNGLWATLDVLNSLRYGDPDLMTDDPKIINRITGLVAEVNSHVSLAEHLSDVLASGLEVVQSIYNNQLQLLNNRLALLVAYLTIIGTALLVPNTIATVMGSPMFDVGPKDLAWYLPLLAVSTIVATLAAYLFVKKMGLLPNKPDSD